MHITDTQFTKLRQLGYVGHLNEMTLKWLQDNGATSPDLSDAWRQYLAIELGVNATGCVPDDRFFQLRGLGYTGARPDMEIQFWDALAVPP